MNYEQQLTNPAVSSPVFGQRAIGFRQKCHVRFSFLTQFHENVEMVMFRSRLEPRRIVLKVFHQKPYKSSVLRSRFVRFNAYSASFDFRTRSLHSVNVYVLFVVLFRRPFRYVRFKQV